MYNTTANTIGIGNAVPAGINTLGSGDLFQFSKKRPYTKKQYISKQKKFNMNPPLLVMTTQYKKKR